MRTIAVVVAALVLVNVVLFGLRRSASAERAGLVEETSVLSQRTDQARLSSEHRRAIDAVVAKARGHASYETTTPRDIGALRDVLVDAERGLSIDRMSLDFRPEERLPTGIGGARVHASLRGRFEAVYDYLERIEAMFLPLSLDGLTLRGDAASVTLTVQWAAHWPMGGSHGAAEISDADVSRLSHWLSRESRPRPQRDVFSFREASGSVAVAPPPRAADDAAEEPMPLVPDDLPERPVLTGFVLARPELEPDVRRRVLAALRYQGETRLVMVGDTIGDYVIDSMEARDYVTLTRADTGESFRLTLP